MTILQSMTPPAPKRRTGVRNSPALHHDEAPMLGGEEPGTPVGTFETDAPAVLGRLCEAVKQLIRSAPVEVNKASDLHRALGIRHSLGWEVFKLAKAAEPLAGVVYVPKPAPMASVLQAAKDKGFLPAAINAVARAYAEFNTLVTQHAPDRETFDTMASALMADSAPEQIGLKQRRGGYQYNSQLWGFCAKVVYACTIWHPAQASSVQNAVSISGNIALRQLRPLAVIPRSTKAMVVDREGNDIGGDVPPFTPQLLEEFCSKPLPNFDVVKEGGKWREVLRLKGVGKGHELTYFLTNGPYNMVPEDQDTNPGWGMCRVMGTPCERYVMDLLVPRGWANPECLSTGTFGNPADVGVDYLHEEYRMPFREHAVYLGSFLDTLIDPDIPNCPEIVRSVLLKQGWQNTIFDVFRCRMRYPIFHSMNMMHVKGPATSSSANAPRNDPVEHT